MDIETVQKRHESQLLQLPNVVGVGIGQKEGNEVIKVFVTRKVPESVLQPQDIIPKALEGYATDVEEIGTVTAQNLQRKKEDSP